MEINEDLDGDPGAINKDAYANWIIKVKLSDPSEVENLMDAAAYAKSIEH